nr:hypothetical protein [Tanacetum cinerariifolium]
MQVTLHYEAIVKQVTLHDKRIVMQVTLHYEAIVMQVTLHYEAIVMQVTLHYEFKQKFPREKVAGLLFCSTWSGGPLCCKPDTQHCKILCDVVYIIYTGEDNTEEEEDGGWICLLGGNNSLGTKKYWGSNSGDGGNTRDGVKIVGGVIGSCGGIAKANLRYYFIAQKSQS